MSLYRYTDFGVIPGENIFIGDKLYVKMNSTRGVLISIAKNSLNYSCDDYVTTYVLGLISKKSIYSVPAPAHCFQSYKVMNGV